MSWSFPEKPFIGLRPFFQDDNLLFFGRREQTQELLKRLHDNRFLAVIGSSGSGKSSLVRAGLVPQLLGGAMVANRDAWLVSTMKPGDDPIYSLAEELVMSTGTSNVEHITQFKEAIDSEGLKAVLEFLKPHLRAKSANLLLIVDQFEEVFRFNLYTNDPVKVEQVTEFVSMLLGLTAQTDIPVYVALTMRSDFLGDCDFFSGLPEALNEGQYLVPRLTRGQRREVIEGPVKLFRGEITARLTDQLLNESGEAKDDLPLLQHALLRTWDVAPVNEKGTKTLDIEHYKQIGEIKGALKQHAEEALDPNNKEDLELTKRVFQMLTQMDSNNRAIRRPAKLSVLKAITGASTNEIKDLIKRFQDDGRLFLVEYAKDNPDKYFVDISHESLIRQWDRLSKWVVEDAEEAALYTRIALRTEEFKETREYLSGGSLERAMEWKERVQPTAAWGKRHVQDVDFDEVIAFLADSKKAEDKRLAEEARLAQEKEHVEKERQEVEQKKELLQAKEEAIVAKARARNAMMLSGALILLILSAALLFVLDQRNTAISARDNAVEANENAGMALLEANYNQAKLFGQKARVAREDSRYPESWLYAVHSINEVVNPNKDFFEQVINWVNFFDSDDEKYLPVSMGAIMAPEVVPSATWSNGVLPTEEAVTDLAYSPDGQYVGLGFVDGRVRILDLDPDAEQREILLWPPFHQITNQTTRVDGLTPEQQRCLGWKRGYLFPDETSNFSTGIVNQLRRCNIPESLHREVIDNAPRFHEQYVWTIAYNSDGNLLASAAPDNSLFLWEFYKDIEGDTQGRLKHFLYVEDKPAMSLAFIANKDTLVAGYEDGIRFWQLNLDNARTNPVVVDTILTGNVSVTSLAMSDSTGTLAVGLYDGRIGLLPEGASEFAFFDEGHGNVVTDLSFSASGDTLASASRDRSIKLWNAAESSLIRTYTGHIAAVNGVSYDPRGRILASGSQDMTVRYWNLEDSTEIARIYQENSITSVTFNPNGANILYGVEELDQLNTLQTTIVPFSNDSLEFDIRYAGVKPKESKELIQDLYQRSIDNLGYELSGINFVVPDPSSGDVTAAGEEVLGLSRSDVLTYSNVANRGFPLFKNTETILIQEGRKSAAQAIFFKEEYRRPFEVSFEYSITNEGKQGWHDYTTQPADGIVLMLLKDRRPYEYQPIPVGGSQAFIQDGSGYGIRFRIFTEGGTKERIELERRGRVQRRYIPSEHNEPAVYTAGEWRKVRVRVEQRRIRVFYDDTEVINWQNTLDRQYGGLGFGAATGGADAEHKIRNIVVNPL